MKAKEALFLGAVLVVLVLSCSLAQAGGVRIGVGIGLPIGIGIGGRHILHPTIIAPTMGIRIHIRIRTMRRAVLRGPGARVWATGRRAAILLSAPAQQYYQPPATQQPYYGGSARHQRRPLCRNRPFHKHSRLRRRTSRQRTLRVFLPHPRATTITTRNRHARTTFEIDRREVGLASTDAFRGRLRNLTVAVCGAFAPLWPIRPHNRSSAAGT